MHACIEITPRKIWKNSAHSSLSSRPGLHIGPRAQVGTSGHKQLIPAQSAPGNLYISANHFPFHPILFEPSLLPCLLLIDGAILQQPLPAFGWRVRQPGSTHMSPLAPTYEIPMIPCPPLPPPPLPNSTHHSKSTFLTHECENKSQCVWSYP